MDIGLTNLEMHEIEQEIDRISAAVELLNPDMLEDALTLARYDEILDYYTSLLQTSYKKARIFESNLRLVV